MSKVFRNKRKTVTAVIAVAMAALIIFGGTFAWQSISQEALNEVSSLRNPGGRLHDDFVDITYDEDGNKVYNTMTFNKDVYVENFTAYAENGVQVFARVRLDEYMEFGVGAGDINAADRDVKSLVHGAELDDKTTWTTYVPGEDSVFNAENPFSKYWNWEIVTDAANADKGVVTYMPTYNKNKDSLEADINGTFDAGFTDHVDYTDPAYATENNYEIVDNDGNTADELDNEHVDLNAVITGDQILGDNYDQHVTVTQKEHKVAESLDAYVITMDAWLELPADQQRGNFWVWDADGWAYWANPINPETATGALLNGISRQQNVINEDWYYGINVVAQFVTKEDLGKENGTGFYDTTDGISKAPSSNALILLNAIGVDVNTTVADGDVAGLQNALELGGNILLNGTYSAEANDTSIGEGYPMSFVWSTGGTLNGGTLVSTTDQAFAGLFINAETGWPETTDGATAAIANEVTVKGSLRSGIYAQAINESITLNKVTVENTYGVGIYAEYGTGKVTLNGCTVSAPTTDTGASDWMLSAVAAADGADVVINGGDYTGKYAAYVYSSGGSITILDGTFTGELKADAGTLTIKGGTFTVDPSDYVDLDYYTVSYENGVYTVY